MSRFAEAVIDGILGGAVYALMAAGLTLIFGVLDIINIAQGVLVVLGAYLSYALSVHLHLDPLLGLLITVPVMFALGVIIEWAFVRRLRGRERTAMSLLVCYAVAVIIEGVLYQIFGDTPVTIQASYATSTVHIFGFYLPYIYLIGAGLAVAALGAIYYMLYRTSFRPHHPGHGAGQGRGPAHRHQRRPGRCPELRDRCRRYRGWRHGFRHDECV